MCFKSHQIKFFQLSKTICLLPWSCSIITSILIQIWSTDVFNVISFILSAFQICFFHRLDHQPPHRHQKRPTCNVILKSWSWGHIRQPQQWCCCQKTVHNFFQSHKLSVFIFSELFFFFTALITTATRNDRLALSSSNLRVGDIFGSRSNDRRLRNYFTMDEERVRPALSHSNIFNCGLPRTELEFIFWTYD